MSHDKPTSAELAAARKHDPLTCWVCCNPHVYGDQASTDDEREIDRLRARVAELEAVVEQTLRPLGSMADHFVRVVGERNRALASAASMRLSLASNYDAAIDAGTEAIRLVADLDVAAERERCAQLADDVAAMSSPSDHDDAAWREACGTIAAVIRARGGK